MNGVEASRRIDGGDKRDARIGIPAWNGAALVMLGVLLGGCQGKSTPSERPGIAAASTTLDVYLNREPGGFDALRQYSSSKAHIQTQMPIFEMLFDMDPATGQLVPHLALSAESAEDGRIWTVKLREGVRFSNGEPFDARAYVVHFERIIGAPIAGIIFQSLGATLKAVRAIDSHTVQFELAEPTPGFDILMATPGLAWFGINAPEHTLQHGKDSDFDLKPVGTGPYMLQSFASGIGLTLVRNPYYWKPEVQHVDAIEYHIMGEGVASFIALKAGDLDMLYASDDLMIARAVRDPEVNTLIGPPDFSGLRWNFNVRKGPLSDLRVRQALAYGVNREAANKVLTQGLAEIATDSYGKRSSWYCPDVRYPEYDPEHARALLRQYGKPVQLTLGILPYASKQAEVFQAMWKDIGVDVKIVVDSLGPGFYKRASSGAFDIWQAPGPSNRYPLLVEMDLKSDNPMHPIGIKSPRIDRAIDKIAANAHNREELYRASCEYQQILAEELPFLRFTFAPNAVVMRKNVVGLDRLTSADAGYYKVSLE